MPDQSHSVDRPDAAPERAAEPATTNPPAPESDTASTHFFSRPWFVNSLIVLTTVIAVIGMFAVWANRLLFNPDNWAKTSTQLLQNKNIRSTTANYLVDQVYANVNVAGALEQALPSRLQPLAGPAAGALRNVAVSGAELALTRPRIQGLWATANRAADQAFISVVEGGRGPVGVKQGVVTLDLAQIIDTVAARLGLPSNLGAKLPPTIGTLTILKSNQIKLVQDIGQAIKGLALLFTILIPLLYALAVVLAVGHRRRTLLSVGLAIVIAGVVVLLLRSLLISQVPKSLTSDASLQTTISAVVSIATGILKEIADAFVLVGAVVVAAAWLAGPARIAHTARHAIAPFMRRHAAATFGITAAIMVVVFIIDPIPATGNPWGILAFLALAMIGTEALRRQVAQEFPDAESGAAVAAVRARVHSVRERRAHSRAGSHPGPSTADQLERLASLRASGDITAEEYAAAKAHVLAG